MGKLRDIVSLIWNSRERNVLVFIIVLFASNAFWKLTISGDEQAQQTTSLVTFCGKDVTVVFDLMARHVAKSTYHLINVFGGNVHLRHGNYLFFDNGVGSVIVWSCSGLKQMFIFTCILLFSIGPWRHKLWFVPLGVVLCDIVNIMRISAITMLIENHRSWFPILHDHIFKYLFYLLIFLYWVIWDTKFAGRQ
ncbi:MAG TPA: hypothetical protein DEO38_05445 [Bacteroidales bacterium]|nr:hypothetical protein [Bacteroidales bacterium]